MVKQTECNRLHVSLTDATVRTPVFEALVSVWWCCENVIAPLGCGLSLGEVDQ